MISNCFGAFNWCKGKDGVDDQPQEQVIKTTTFSYNSLRSATGDFHPSSKIGGGGYGVVYKGALRDGTQVAIKSLSVDSKQGSHEFMTEINMISNIRHPNLVELIGCCVEGSHRILVYEFMENNSLASSLLGPRSKYIPLDWPKRAAICHGTASGLRFLHEEAQPNIVHRDIKASNILLDGNFNPKIGDFGLAKLFPDNVTHVSTRVAGTLGYLAPEYALLGQLTKKADVYSFGVLMLEIISGKSSSKAAFGDNLLVLVEWNLYYKMLLSPMYGLLARTEKTRPENNPLTETTNVIGLVRASQNDATCPGTKANLPRSAASNGKAIGAILPRSTASNGKAISQGWHGQPGSAKS
ncbi:hypothetical protein Lal_00038398 [Lupinus albus]|nr:hypothetical protein Lal_00038398 [Lupinus albus]